MLVQLSLHVFFLLFVAVHDRIFLIFSLQDDDNDGEYLVQPIAQPATARVDFDACNQEDEDEVDDDEDDLHSNIALQQQPSSASNPNKRRRGEEDDLDDDSVEDLRRSKHP